VAFVANAEESNFEFGGHSKLNLIGQTWPDDSILRSVLGSSTVDLQGELRLVLEWRDNGWAFDAAYQLVGLSGDSLNIGSDLPPLGQALFGRLPNDERRLFDLTNVITESGDSALLHRLDRLWVGYSTDKTVLRFGRQALSWGNGLFYAPMDLVNPFDPAAIDTEYKVGDDLFYGQFLRDSGDDIQAAAVFRRNLLTGDVESDEATIALKYHGFAGEYEYDLLVAKSYGDPVVGLGIGRSIGGAQWGADLVATDTRSDTTIQFVTNLTYSWELAGKNMSGALEYHFNGFGQSGGRYDPLSLAANPDLLLRLARGQSFTLGRHYLAASVMIELTPLWSVTPVMLANVSDPSALLQLTMNYSLGDNMTLLGNVNIPLGENGTEFGGIETGVADLYLSSGAGVFAQFAWYF
jgi:hypothetical protein